MPTSAAVTAGLHIVASGMTGDEVGQGLHELVAERRSGSEGFNSDREVIPNTPLE
jgi:hypothetical protein